MATQTVSISKHLNTVKLDRNLKNNARVKVATKSDLIRAMLQKNLSVRQIKNRLEKRGLGVYPSEIYRLK